MSWEQLGALGELTSAIASIVLLGYIAIQIRQNSKALQQNTRATEAAARHEFATQDQAFLSSAMDSTLLAQAVAKLENGEALSPLENSQLVQRQHVNFRIFEAAYSQVRRGILERGEWERYERIIRSLIHGDEPARQMWDRFRENFDPKFASEVERIRGIG